MGKAKFRYLPHTADVAFVAYGKSFRETIENSALAMLGLMFETKKIKAEKGKTKTLRITERASGKEDLLWFTLQAIVSKVDEKGASAFRFKVNSISESGSGLVLHGCIFYKRMREYSSLLDVKGVTPHELAVSRTRNGYSARVLVDV